MKSKKFLHNGERQQHLHSLLIEGEPKDRMQAHKLAYEWVVTGVFGRMDLILYLERVAAVSSRSDRHQTTSPARDDRIGS